jgi:hypothetical protein
MYGTWMTCGGLLRFLSGLALLEVVHLAELHFLPASRPSRIWRVSFFDKLPSGVEYMIVRARTVAGAVTGSTGRARRRRGRA